MADEEYDKLAWGLVKDELRRLIKPREVMGFEETIARIIKPGEFGLYKGQGALSELKVKKARSKAISDIETRLSTFGHETMRGRMEIPGGIMNVDSFFSWDFKEVGLEDTLIPNSDRREKFLELRNLNFAVGKRKLFMDMLSCFILVNQHTLYRMLQRGAVSRNPVALLSSKFDEWSGFAAMYMLCHKFLGAQVGNNVLIPFCGGALLGKIGFMQPCYTEQGWDRHCLRFFDSVSRGGIETAPYESLLADEFKGASGNVTLQIATWIPEDIYHSEQHWADQQIQALARKYQHVVDFSKKCVSRRLEARNEKHDKAFYAQAEEFSQDLARIFSDRRWAKACQW